MESVDPITERSNLWKVWTPSLRARIRGKSGPHDWEVEFVESVDSITGRSNSLNPHFP